MSSYSWKKNTMYEKTSSWRKSKVSKLTVISKLSVGDLNKMECMKLSTRSLIIIIKSEGRT